MFKKKQKPKSFKMIGQKRIYMDYAAATPVRKEVLDAMRSFWDKDFGNPGAIHKEGVVAKNAIEESRKNVAKVLKCHNDEIIFTGSGTESINLSIKGVCKYYVKKGNHIITSKIEHHAVLETFEEMEKN